MDTNRNGTRKKYYCVADATWQPYPNSKIRGAKMGPIWGRQDPGGPHVGPTNFAIWVRAQHDNGTVDEEAFLCK